MRGFFYAIWNAAVVSAVFPNVWMRKRKIVSGLRLVERKIAVIITTWVLWNQRSDVDI